MKILVTGHKGFIGQNMADELKRFHEVETYEWGDKFPLLSGLDWVIHLGAISSTTETNVEKIMEQNYDFSINLLRSCIEHKVNFQFASSASVYGLGNNFSENSPVDPRTPYSWSKYLFERYARSVKSDTIIQMFRYFNVYGPKEEHKGSQASPFFQFENQAKTGIIKVFENSDQYHRDFIHVFEIIEYHKRFFNVKQSGLWNLGTGKTRSFLDVANIYKSKYNCELVTIPMPDNLKNSYQKYTKADRTKLDECLRKWNV